MFELSLQNQVAVVTGGSRGTGRAIALAFAPADLVLAARTRATLERIAEEVRALGRNAVPVIADVADPGAVLVLDGGQTVSSPREA